MSDVVVIGAGINGLLLCRELAESGCRVTLLDKGQAFGEAWWAGGGIVSAVSLALPTAGNGAGHLGAEFLPWACQRVAGVDGHRPGVVQHRSVNAGSG